MALFKKKPQVVTEITAASNSADEPTKTPPKAKARLSQSRSLTSGAVMLLLPLLLAFGLLFVVIESQFLAKAEQAQAERNNQLVLATMRQQLDSALRQRIAQVEHYASKVSLLERDNIAIELKRVMPDLQQVYVLETNVVGVNPLENAGISFASADLVRKVAAGEKVKIDAFYENKLWRFQIAARLAVNEQSPGQGVLLCLFNMDELKKQFRLPVDAVGQASVLASAEGNPIFSTGADGAEQALESASSVSQWLVTYRPASVARVQIFDRFPLIAMIGGIGAVTVLIVFVMARFWAGRIKTELAIVTQHLLSAANGDGQKVKPLKYSEISMLDAGVSQALREQLKRMEGMKMKEPAAAKVDSKPSTQKRDAPLFDDDDLLDLDVLSASDVERDPLQQDADGLDHGSEMVKEVAGLDIDVPQSIFRAYDIRGVVNETLSPAIVELIGKALASEAKARAVDTLCVGFDGRLSSLDYCDAIVRGILSTGVNAIVVGRVPTPVLYFATHHFGTGSGVMITGSHNPANYNGFKMMLAGSTLANDDIQKLYNRILLQDFAEGHGELKEQPVAKAYVDTILNDIAVAAPLKVVIDAGNGVAGAIAPELIEELGCEVIPLYCDVDGNFPNHHPDPGKPENLRDLINAVREHGADLGLAFDGDGDRVGVVTNTGKIIWPDRLLMLFAKDVVSRNPGSDIIFDVKCSRRLNGLITSYGGRPIMWKTGHSLIKAKMKETGALLAGEMSGHIFFKERWFGFDDGIYSAARLLEILGVEDRKADEVFASFPEDVSTPEINIEVTDESKFTLVEKLCARKEQFRGGNVSTIDGLRVDFPNGWGLCRASNTTPVLVLRFEADDEASLEEIKQKFRDQLLSIEPMLDINF